MGAEVHGCGAAREGDKLVQLVGWLRAGNVEREAGLLKALAQAPLPRMRDPTAAPGAGEAGAGPIARHIDLEEVCKAPRELKCRVSCNCVPLPAALGARPAHTGPNAKQLGLGLARESPSEGLPMEYQGFHPAPPGTPGIVAGAKLAVKQPDLELAGAQACCDTV